MYAGNTQAAAPTSQDTLLSLLSEVEGVSSSVNRNIGQVADSLSGGQLDSGGANEAPKALAAIDRLRSVLYTLQSANGEAGRAKRALGIDTPEPLTKYNNPR